MDSRWITVFKEKKETGLTTLYNSRLQDLAIPMHKYKLTLIYRQNMFEENGATYQLRNGNGFKIPRLWTVGYGKHSIVIWIHTSGQDFQEKIRTVQA